jgi:hypothetical protein
MAKAFWRGTLRRGTGSILVGEESSKNPLLAGESKLLPYPESRKYASIAHYLRDFCRERENPRLAGGETVHTNSRAPFVPPLPSLEDGLPLLEESFAGFLGVLATEGDANIGQLVAELLFHVTGF